MPRQKKLPVKSDVEYTDVAFPDSPESPEVIRSAKCSITLPRKMVSQRSTESMPSAGPLDYKEIDVFRTEALRQTMLQERVQKTGTVRE